MREARNWALDPLVLWRLEPIDTDHVDWRASSHQGPAVVRAQSETLARWHAALRFHVQTRRRAGEDESPTNPWTNPERVRAKKGKVEKSGQPGVIEPMSAAAVLKLLNDPSDLS